MEHAEAADIARFGGPDVPPSFFFVAAALTAAAFVPIISAQAKAEQPIVASG
ncbi:MAG TPA: hypothetical protein VJ859_02885 [Allosphingosinicella sp.]|nr:hypothetical protein [Allosphingosinicella sp.]